MIPSKQLKAQSSIEFLIITGVGLFLLTTIAIGFVSYTKTTSDQTSLTQVSDIGQKLIGQASVMYSVGGYSWVTVDAVLPTGVVAIYTVEDNTLVFDVQTQKGLVSQPIFSNTPITGVRADGAKMMVNPLAVPAHDGPVKFRVTSLGPVVEIQAVS